MAPLRRPRRWARGDRVEAALAAPGVLRDRRLLFLAAMGLGLGDLVNRGSGDVEGVSYQLFVTGGLMAAAR